MKTLSKKILKYATPDILYLMNFCYFPLNPATTPLGSKLKRPQADPAASVRILDSIALIQLLLPLPNVGVICCSSRTLLSGIQFKTE